MTGLESVAGILALIRIAEKYGVPAVEEALGVKPQVDVTVQEIESLMGIIKKPEDYFKGEQNEET